MPAPLPPTCQTYRDARLRHEALSVAMRAHAAACRDCQAVDRLLAALAAESSAPPRAGSEPAPAVDAAIRAHAHRLTARRLAARPRRWRRWRALPAWSAAAAAMVALALGLWWLGQAPPSGAPAPGTPIVAAAPAPAAAPSPLPTATRPLHLAWDDAELELKLFALEADLAITVADQEMISLIEGSY